VRGVEQTERGGASITTIDPGVAVSTKWEESFGADLSDASTIWTVYAGAQTLTWDIGESICTSGMCPPFGDPSFMRASEISQAENCNSGHVEEGVDVDITRLMASRRVLAIMNQGVGARLT
jgi:hypothetical protein